MDRVREPEDVMADAILEAGRYMGALAHRTAQTFERKIVAFQIEALKRHGFEIRPLPSEERR
jgi:hypothetical protein